MASTSTYTRIVLNERPQPSINHTTLRKDVVPFDELKPGPRQLLIKVAWVSLDPAVREWMNDVSIGSMPPVTLGETMRALGVGHVVKRGSGCSFQVGALVWGFTGMAEYAILDEGMSEVLEVPDGIGAEAYLGPLGITGMSAYFGLKEIARLKSKQTLVVSAAAGSTGSMACQLGKMMGAKVVAIAGSDKKCAWLRDAVGCDVALNYKRASFVADFEREVDKYNVYFDNVGGTMLDYMLTRMNRDAVIVLCGAISQLEKETPDGLTNHFKLIEMRGKMQGLIATDYLSQWGEGRRIIANGMRNGSLKCKYHVIDGLENAPAALSLLFTGQNEGKLIVKVSDTPVQPAI